MKNEIFIKSYKKINCSSKLNLIEKSIISQILSFQDDNKIFFQQNKTLAKAYHISEKSVETAIKKFKQFDWYSSEYNKSTHVRTIKINEEMLFNWLDVQPSIEENPSTKIITNDTIIETINNNVNYSITDTQIEETYPSITEEEITQYNEELIEIIKMTKSELKAKYDDYQKFSNGRPLDIPTFHILTNDYFKNSEVIPLKKLYMILLSTGTFDGFYAEIIKLLELTETIKQN
jgi:hypothetical protein